MISYVVKRPFTAGKPPSDVREYRVGDELTQGDVDMWEAGEYAKATQLGQLSPVAPAVEPAPAQPEPAPAPATHS